MFDTYEVGRFHANAFPPVLRAASYLLSTAIVGAFLIGVFATGAGIVA